MSYIGNNLENDISTRRYEYTATAGQTVFPCAYDKGVDVYLNGFCLSNTDYIATDGVSVVLNTGATAGQIVIIKAYVSVMNLPQSIMEQHTYTATASQTTFSINYTIGFVYVFVNGIRLANTDYTATNGTSVILNDACNAGDIVECISFNTFVVANAYTKAEVNTIVENIDALPSQSGNNGKYLSTDGTNASWAALNTALALSNDTIAVGETQTIASGKQLVVDHLDVQGTLDIQGTLATVSGGYLSQTTMKTQSIINSSNSASPVNFPINPTINGTNLSPFTGLKNYIINGNFDVWQRGTSQTTSGYGSDDRWYNANLDSTKTHSQVLCTDTERLLFNASKFSRTVVSSVVAASSYAIKRTSIEDVTKLAGKTITLSFWAKADSNKNIWLEFKQSFGTGGSPSAQTIGIYGQAIPLTTTWQKKTITVTLPSIAGKTLGADGVHTTSTEMQFWFDVGSDHLARIPTGIQQSGTFDIAQVQLEEGSVATPFEQRPYGLELMMCQRYYQINMIRAVLGAGNYAGWGMPRTVIMRTVPSIIFSDLVGAVNKFSTSSGNGRSVVGGGVPPYADKVFADALLNAGTFGEWVSIIEFASAEL